MARTDEAISKFHPDGNILDSTILGYGSYVGEVIRRNLGGKWVQDERGVALLEQIGGIDLKAFPFSWTQKRFTNGEEDSLAFKFAVLKNEVVKANGQVPAPAADAPPSTYVGDPLLGPAIDQLGRSPLLVFIMVAAADGKVDKKEMIAFRQILENIEDCSSQLLIALIQGVTIPKIEIFLSELTSGDVSPIDELKSIAVTLDQYYAEHARQFKESLVDIARRIAEASGGVFGFGQKIDENETTVIAGIALMLGLHGDSAAVPVESSDLELLGHAPVIIFLEVAAADGNIDKKEVLAFRKILENRELCPSPLFKEALETVTLPNLQEILGRLTSTPFNAQTELKRVAAMLDEKHPQEARVCKTILVTTGKRIAEASGGLFGFGKKIGDEEQETISGIAEALGLPEAAGN
ncbi:MAG: hypothetical protein K0Q55_4224 [Verrucomicrobia bacterium]|jgi:uncharacterized tellurite resistance protein B-like protein|nr:hypothetical protein [Verrucomicrobiota bacterium]